MNNYYQSAIRLIVYVQLMFEVVKRDKANVVGSMSGKGV